MSNYFLVTIKNPKKLEERFSYVMHVRNCINFYSIISALEEVSEIEWISQADTKKNALENVKVWNKTWESRYSLWETPPVIRAVWR